jgi:hypothetical protein
MSHRRTFPGVARGVLALTFALAAASCSHRVTDVDSGFTAPEGTFSPDARLIVYPDLPNQLVVYQDHVPPGPDPNDDILFQRDYRRATAGAIHGQLLDHTAADAFQAFRTEDNGGVRQFTDFPAPRMRQWLDTQWELYHFVDPSPAAPARYVARGLVDQVANARSPLSNVGSVDPAPPANINLTAVFWPRTAATHPEGRGKLKVHWDAVQNAARYLLQVYELRGDIRTVDEIILSGVPSPLYDRQTHDLFVGYVPSNVDFMFVGDSTRTDIETLTLRPFGASIQPLVRLTALDATGRMVATTRGDAQTILSIAGDNTYGIFQLNAVVGRDTVQPPVVASMLVRDVPFLGGGVRDVDPNRLPRSYRRLTRSGRTAR